MINEPETVIETVPCYISSKGRISNVLKEWLREEEYLLLHAVRSERLKNLSSSTVLRFPEKGALLNGMSLILSIEPHRNGHKITAITVLRANAGIFADHA